MVWGMPEHVKYTSLYLLNNVMLLLEFRVTPFGKKMAAVEIMCLHGYRPIIAPIYKFY